MSGVSALKARFEQQDAQAQNEMATISKGPPQTPPSKPKAKKSWGKSNPSPRLSPSPSPRAGGAKKPPPPRPKVPPRRTPSPRNSPSPSPKFSAPAPPSSRAPPPVPKLSNVPSYSSKKPYDPDTPTSKPKRSWNNIRFTDKSDRSTKDSNADIIAPETPTWRGADSGPTSPYRTNTDPETPTFSAVKIPPRPPVPPKKKSSSGWGGFGKNNNKSTNEEKKVKKVSTGGGTASSYGNYGNDNVYSDENVKLAIKNEEQMAHCKLIGFIIFWIGILIQGIISMVDSEGMLIIMDYYSRGEACNSDLKNDKEYGLNEDMSLYELAETAYIVAEGWVVVAGLFVTGLILIYVFMMSNLYILSNKKFACVNYIMAHVLSCPAMYALVALWQILALINYEGYALQIEFAGSLALETDLSISCESGAYDTMSDQANSFNLVRVIGIMIYVIFGMIIPIIVSCMYCVRGRKVFKDYQDEGMDCFIYCRCCLGCSRPCCACPCCWGCCCMGDFPMQ